VDIGSPIMIGFNSIVAFAIKLVLLALYKMTNKSVKTSFFNFATAQRKTPSKSCQCYKPISNQLTSSINLNVYRTNCLTMIRTEIIMELYQKHETLKKN